MGQVIEYGRHLDTGGLEELYFRFRPWASALPTLWLLTHYWNSRCPFITLTFTEAVKTYSGYGSVPWTTISILHREVAKATDDEDEDEPTDRAVHVHWPAQRPTHAVCDGGGVAYCKNRNTHLGTWFPHILHAFWGHSRQPRHYCALRNTEVADTKTNRNQTNSCLSQPDLQPKS